MGYPNEFDRSLGRTGSELMVHGACSSRGCYSMTDENIQEIYTLGRLAFQGGQRDFQVEAFPFRMTPENMARHRNDPNMPFWLMLKEGYDHFEVAGQPPQVNVCEHRYIFNSVAENGRSFDPAGSCPPMAMPDTIRVAVAEKQARDNAKMLQIAERLDRREGGDGAELLMAALDTPTSAQRAAPMSVANASVTITPSTRATPEQQPLVPAPAPAVASASPPTLAPAPAPRLAPAPSVASSAPAPVPVPAPRPARAAVATAPAAAPARASSSQASASGFLPLPDLRGEVAAAPPPPPPAAPPPSAAPQDDKATLEERMLVESAPADPSVANAYAAAEQENGGLTGFVLRLMKQQ